MKRSPMPRPKHPIPRYVTLKPGKPPRKARIKRKTRKQRAMQQVAQRNFVDGRNVAFSEAHGLLGFDHAKWPKRGEDVIDLAVCARMHGNFGSIGFRGGQSNGVCWLCGSYGHLDAHHIVSRSDEPCNIIMAGGSFSFCKCHARIQDNPATLPEVLRAKVKHDKQNTDWCRLAVLRGSWFPFDELEVG